MSSTWGGWGNKLNVTSIVSQGIEQVRSLREDVEKSFDNVVAGVPGVSVSQSLVESDFESQEQIDGTIKDLTETQNSTVDVAADKMQSEEEIVDSKAENLQLKIVKAKKSQDEADEVLFDGDTELREEKRKPTDAACNESTTDPGQLEKEIQAKALEFKAIPTNEDIADALNVPKATTLAKQTLLTSDQLREMTTDEANEAIIEVVASQHQGEKNYEEKIAEHEQCKDELESLESCDVVLLRKELLMRESQLLATSTTIQELHDELDKTCYREVAAVGRVQNLTAQLESMRQEVTKLMQLQRDTSTSQHGDVQSLQIALAEKEEKLGALLNEGQALSIKQAQLEQRLRMLRKEKDEVEIQALKYQSQLEASTKEVNILSTKLKSCEDEKTRFLQENTQLSSSLSTASAEAEKAEKQAQEALQEVQKLQTQAEKLTQDLSKKANESEQLKALTQSNEELELEKDELERTVMFLQNQIHDLEQDTARQEGKARTEILYLRQKWQDAMVRVDLLGQSVSEATQPMLHQIHELREEQRLRQEKWKACEIALLSQMEEANKKCRDLEEKKLETEQKMRNLEQTIEENELVRSRTQGKLETAEKIIESARVETRELRGQIDALKIDLNQAKRQCDINLAAKQQLQARLESIETCYKEQETSSAAAAKLEQAQEREAQLRQDIAWLEKELQQSKSLTLAAPLSTGSTSSQLKYGKQNFDRDECDRAMTHEAAILKTTLETKVIEPTCMNAGKTLVLGLSQLQQRLHLREGENRLLKQQLEALEARQKETTDEIVRLSTRNALLESVEAQREQALVELAKLQKHQVVLLELFGEKEEQVEELQTEVDELKAFYRKQLDTL